MPLNQFWHFKFVGHFLKVHRDITGSTTVVDKDTISWPIYHPKKKTKTVLERSRRAQSIWMGFATTSQLLLLTSFLPWVISWVGSDGQGNFPVWPSTFPVVKTATGKDFPVVKNEEKKNTGPKCRHMIRLQCC